MIIPETYSTVFFNYELALGRVNSRLAGHAFSRSKKEHRIMSRGAG